MNTTNLLLVILLVIGVYFVLENEDAKPTQAERAMQDHCDIMARLGTPVPGCR